MTTHKPLLISTGPGTVNIQLTIPSGGSVSFLGKTYNSSSLVTIQKSDSNFLVKGKGGTGSVRTIPGQSAIPPSGPIYEKRIYTHAVGSWNSAGEDVDMHHYSPLFPTQAEAEADRVSWLNRGPEFSKVLSALTNSTSAKVSISGFYSPNDSMFGYNTKDSFINSVVFYSALNSSKIGPNYGWTRPNALQIATNFVNTVTAGLGPYLRMGCTGWHSSYIGVVFNPTLSPDAESKVSNRNGTWNYKRSIRINSKAYPTAPVQEEYDHQVGWSDPGRPSTPSTTVNVKGDPTTLKIDGKIILSFEGGNGGEAVLEEKTFVLT